MTDGAELIVTAAYVPEKLITPPDPSVKLCEAGLLCPNTAPQVTVYVPVGFEGYDCEVPEPNIVLGPVIVHVAEIFVETLTVPTGEVTVTTREGQFVDHPFASCARKNIVRVPIVGFERIKLAEFDRSPPETQLFSRHSYPVMDGAGLQTPSAVEVHPAEVP